MSTVKFTRNLPPIIFSGLCALGLTLAPSLAHAGPGAGPVDLSVMNEDALIDMLIDHGYLEADASPETARAAARQYANDLRSMADMQDDSSSLEARGDEQTTEIYRRIAEQTGSQVRRVARRGGLSALSLENYNGDVTHDRVLAILIEFPDYGHNDVLPHHTQNYYPDYNPAHYDELLFSESGVTGPQGQNFVTMRQYYRQQSGGSYDASGQVDGWYVSSQPAAYYGDNNDLTRPRELVREALLAMVAAGQVNLDDFDQEDRYDLDGDGNFREPDGLIDHLMIFHASVGEEAGGGGLGPDAIWSHRWNLGQPFILPGTSAQSDNFGGAYAAFDYTIQAVDAGAGICAHEYAHDLGLPDEYDIGYTGKGEAVAYWSIMSAGSWTGAIAGTEPVGFSPFAREFLQASMGGNWLHGAVVESDDLDAVGTTFDLDQANDKGADLDYVRINLPPKQIHVADPYAGQYAYYSGKDDNLTNAMVAQVDLTGASDATLNFKTWYDIEAGWDYAYVFVNGILVPGTITTTDNPNGANIGHGITGNSGGWVDAEFDLSAFAGAPATVVVYYVTDAYQANEGMMIDDLSVDTNIGTVFADGGEAAPQVALFGWTHSDGHRDAPHYYLVEWRNHAGVDAGLDQVNRYGQTFSYEPGLLIWYVDLSFAIQDNAVGEHPGEGWLGVVDADRHPMYWSGSNEIAETAYQIRDATFRQTSLQDGMSLTHPGTGETVSDLYPLTVPTFIDWDSYQQPAAPQSGRILPHLGLIINVEEQRSDLTGARIRVRKVW